MNLTTFEFEVPGPCHGKERPRFRRIGKFVTTYTPKKTKDYEKLVAKSFKKVAKGKKLEGAIKAEICAIYEPPKSVSKKIRQQMLNNEIPYIKKPDSDNCIKGVLDSINRIAYEDDSAIDEVHAYKMYGEKAHTQVRLTDEKHAIKPFWFDKEDKQKTNDDD